MRVQTFISPTRNFISSNADFRFLGKLSPVWVRLESYLEERERCRQSPSSYFFLNTHFPHHTFSSVYFFSSYFFLNTFSHHTFPIILFLNILFLIIHFPFHIYICAVKYFVTTFFALQTFVIIFTIPMNVKSNISLNSAIV